MNIKIDLLTEWAMCAQLLLKPLSSGADSSDLATSSMAQAAT